MAVTNFGTLLLMILIATNSLMFAEALKCYQCGQYTDGAGSITPCLNYTEQTAPFYLKDCPRSSNAYCIVSVSALSASLHILQFEWLILNTKNKNKNV